MLKYILLLWIFTCIYAKYTVVYQMIPFTNVCRLNRDVSDHIVSKNSTFDNFRHAKFDIANKLYNCQYLEASLKGLSIYSDVQQCCIGQPEYLVVYITGQMYSTNSLKFLYSD